MADAAPPRRRPARAALTFFLLYHLAAMTTANMPRSTALGGSPHAAFDPYVSSFALWQSWDMFTTIPHFLSLEGVLVSFDGQRHPAQQGPLLPGLRPFERRHRLSGTFLRLAFSADHYPGVSDRYLAAVCRALRARDGVAPAGVGFELRVEQMRPLAEIRSDGRIADPKIYTFGPAACAH